VTEETAQTTTTGMKSLLRRIIPSFLLKQRGIVARLGPGAGRTYANLCLLDMLGVRTMNQRLAPPSARSFLFVCYGNIMRSAMAEFLMRKALEEIAPGDAQRIRIVSAGLHANPGREAHPWAQEAAAALGVSLAQHRAKQLSREMMEQADCVFAMDFQNKAELQTLYPEAQNKICMLSAYAEGPEQYREIVDPYLGNPDSTRASARLLQKCAQNLLAATGLSAPGSNRLPALRG